AWLHPGPATPAGMQTGRRPGYAPLARETWRGERRSAEASGPRKARRMKARASSRTPYLIEMLACCEWPLGPWHWQRPSSVILEFSTPSISDGDAPCKGSGLWRFWRLEAGAWKLVKADDFRIPGHIDFAYRPKTMEAKSHLR